MKRHLSIRAPFYVSVDNGCDGGLSGVAALLSTYSVHIVKQSYIVSSKSVPQRKIGGHSVPCKAY